MEEEEKLRSMNVFEYGELVHIVSSDVNETACLVRFMHSLGPAGCGLVAVRGVPSLLSTRQALLPLARYLALLPPLQRSTILKEHGLGTDVSFKDPDRRVSSFAAQLCFDEDHKYMQRALIGGLNTYDKSSHCQLNDEHIESELRQLGSLFKELGKAMVEVGLLVARICDMAIPGAGLEGTILQACTAKGRLIHYHSLAERLFHQAILSSVVPKKCKKKKMNQVMEDSSSSTIKALGGNDLWQQWHFDYGILTVLTVPMFLSIWDMDFSYAGAASAHIPSFEATSSRGDSKVDSDVRQKHIGLNVLNTRDRCVEFVSVPPDCLIIQVGEVAQILTGGKLRATAHCVCRPPGRPDISRETFVVFLQPTWHKQLYWPKDPGTDAEMHDHLDHEGLVASGSGNFDEDFQEIQRIIPALESRWKNGSTFADFSKETTKQYYGANGAQSKG